MSSDDGRSSSSSSASFVAGLGAGLSVTTAFNPYDRALYLSVAHARPFVAAANWTTPYQAWTQTLASRALSAGLYFPLEVPPPTRDSGAYGVFYY